MADINEEFNKINNTPDSTAEYDPADVQKNKGLSVLAYLGILVLIPLLAAKDSKFARFHCNQGIVLAIVEIAASIVISVLGGIRYVGWIFSLAGGILDLICFIFAIMGIINAANGKAKELPLIGSIKIVK